MNLGEWEQVFSDAPDWRILDELLVILNVFNHEAISADLHEPQFDTKSRIHLTKHVVEVAVGFTAQALVRLERLKRWHPHASTRPKASQQRWLAWGMSHVLRAVR